MTDDRRNKPSASGIEQIHLCPGSWEAQQGLPRLDDEADAERGNRIHAAVAAYLESGAPMGLTANDGLTADVCIGVVLDHVRQVFDANAGPTFPGERVIERRLWVYDEDGSLLASGKPDVVYVHNRKALIIDFKTGWIGATAAEENLQLRALALAAHGLFDFDTARVVLVSPNTDNPVTWCEYTEADLDASFQELKGIIARIPGGPRIPGAKQCRWCRAKHVCPEAVALAVGIPAALGVEHMEGTRNKHQQAAVKLRLLALEPAEVSSLLEKIGVIEWVCAQIQAHAKMRLEAEPGSIPGWKLAPGASRRTVTDAALAFQRINRCDACREGEPPCTNCKGTGYVERMTEEQFLACATVKIAELDAAYKGVTGLSAGAAKADLEARLGDVVERKQNRPSLEKV